jgi:hypothetical protein
MMAFSTRCFKSPPLKWRDWLWALVCAWALLLLPITSAQATTPQLQLERIDAGLWLSTQLEFELPKAVEDALGKGIVVDFLATTEVVRSRWYWINQTVSSVQRRMRLSYQPLTSRWRLTVTNGDTSDLAQGLSLNQSFDTLADAMVSIRRFYRWRIGDANAIASANGISKLIGGAGKYWVKFRFELDVAQFFMPLQIGTLGQTDWQVFLEAEQELGAEAGK